METLPIDFDLTLTQLSEWHDKWRLERFRSNDNTRYYQTDGRCLYGVIQDTELCEEKAIQERVLDLLCLIREANMKLKGIGLNWHLTYQERENIKSTREALYKELTQFIKPQQKQAKQQETTKLIRGKGRPKETLTDKMIDDANGEKLKMLHTKLDGKKGKDVSLIILAAIKKGWLTKPTYTQVKNEFKDIGCKTGYNKYLNENLFTKEEIEGAINSFD
ncbi:hypothetical protein [Prevotella histicola]